MNYKKNSLRLLFHAPLCALVFLVALAPSVVTAVDKLPGVPIILVKGGCFMMGDTFGDGGIDEKPVHEVCLDDFFMGKFEVTQEQWEAVMGNNPSKFKKNGNYPVENVSWDDAQEFTRRLSRLTGFRWRLPTEAEWEYAARSGGRKQEFAGSVDARKLDDYAWYEANSEDRTHPVGEKKPNGLELYDMSGNAWEWVQDRYDRDYYKQSARSNPQGDPFGLNRIVKGGSARTGVGFLRASYRDYVAPDTRGPCFGLRLALSAQK